MAAAAFDTLKLVRALRDKAKFSPEQAEGLADAMAEAMEGDIATKTDLREVELRLTADLGELESRLKAEIEASKAELVKWMFGSIGFQTLIVLGAVVALARIIAK